jgi:hypothetical protein
LLIALLPSGLVAPETQTRTVSIRIPINVANASLPVSIGVPISEAPGVFDAAQLGVTDANGATVPSQMRALARWRGGASDASKPIK